MRALEDALAIAQANEGDEPHPLLREPLKFEYESPPLEPDDEDENTEGSEATPLEALADSFGTLHIDQKEKTLRFYGPTGGVEVRL